MKVGLKLHRQQGPGSSSPDPFSALPSGLRTPSAAGTDPPRRRLRGQIPEGVPAHETDAGPQSNHGSPAEVPTMPHGCQTVGHVGVWLIPGLLSSPLYKIKFFNKVFKIQQSRV